MEVKYILTVDSSGAISGVRATNSELKGLDKTMKTIQGESKKVGKAKADMGKAAARATNEASKGIKGMTAATGGLTGSLKTTAQTIAAVEGPFGGLSGRLNAMATLTNTVSGNLNKATASAKAFRIALLATGIGAIVVALGTLIQAFRSTQEGTDRLNRILVPLRATLGAIWGVIQDLSIALADTLVAAIKDPRQALKDLGDFLVSQVTNRVKGLIDSFGALGRVISRLIRGDFAGAREAAVDFGNAFLQAATGIEDAGHKLANFTRRTIEAAQAGMELGRRIQELNEQIERLRIEQTVPLARLKREYEELRSIAGDQLRTEQERLEAIEQAEKILRNIEAQERRVLDLEIERLELQQAINDTSREEELELQKLIARREELAASTVSQFRRLERQRTSIIKGIQDQIQKEREQHLLFIAGLEERADKMREMLMSEEQLIFKSYDARHVALNELLDNDILSYEEYIDLRFELEARMNEELLALTKGRIEAEQDLEDERINNMREQYIELSNEIAGLLGVMFGNSKNLIIAQAIIDAYAAYNRTIAAGGAFAVPLAALTLAKGMAQVATMRSIEPKGFQTGGLVGGGRRLIEVNEDGRSEFVMNSRSTSAGLPVLQAMNQSPSMAASIAKMVTGFQSGGATGSVRLDSSQFQKDFSRMADNMKNVQVVLSSFDVTEKVSDQQGINSRRIAITN